jgi:hypothetical protein
MEEFLPHYVDADLNMPKKYEHTYALFFDLLKLHYEWTDIKYTKAQLDIADTDIEIIDHEDEPH